MMKLYFNDGSEINILSSVENNGSLTVSPIGLTATEIYSLFTDINKTRTMTIMAPGNTYVYTGYTTYDSIRVISGLNYEVTVCQTGMTIDEKLEKTESILDYNLMMGNLEDPGEVV